MPLDFSEILVTGGAGFIGSHIVDRLLDEELKVRVLDNLSTGEKKNLAQHKNKKSFQFIEGDIRNFDLVKKAVEGVDAVIHEAALVSVTRSIENPLLRCTRKTVCSRFLLCRIRRHQNATKPRKFGTQTACTLRCRQVGSRKLRKGFSRGVRS